MRAIDVHALPLRPDKAANGCEVRLIGNDSGMDLTIGRAAISRMDCNAPEIENTYGDFNINYIMAAFTARGGSSGSPAVNKNGEVVALQCAGTSNGSLDFLLPVDLPQKALQCLREGRLVDRGTLQIKWKLQPLHDCRRRGLPLQKEKVFREQLKSTSAIYAETVLPGGPAEGMIEVGDILLKVNGQPCADLLQLERCMDSSVGETVELTYWRQGQVLEAHVRTEDLHTIIPHRLFTRAGVAFHQLSYQQAVIHSIPVKGVYVAGGSSAFLNNHILESINGKETPDLDSLIAVQGTIADGSVIRTCHKHLSAPTTPIVRTGHLLFHPSGTATRKKEPRNGGPWVIAKGTSQESLPAVKVEPQQIEREITKPVTISSLTSPALPRPVDEIFSSVVTFARHPFANVEGQDEASQVDVGIIVDADKRLVLAPRDDTTLFAEIIITIFGTIDVKARVIFLDHAANLMVLKYDPMSATREVRAISLAASSHRPGDKVYYAGFHPQETPVVETTVEQVSDMAIHAQRANPHFYPFCSETVFLQTPLAMRIPVGALLNEEGAVTALQFPAWVDNEPLPYTIPAKHVVSVALHIIRGTSNDLRYLSFDTTTIPSADAARRGLSETRLSQIESGVASKRELLAVRRVALGLPSKSANSSDNPLRNDDIILAMDKKVITKTRDLQYVTEQQRVLACIFRDGQELTLEVPTIPATELDISSYVSFCGAHLHKPSLAIRMSCHPLHSEVYVASLLYGSPADLYGLRPTAFIVAVWGRKILTMEDFEKAISSIPNNKYFYMTLNVSNRRKVVTLMKNEEDFPSYKCTRKFPYSSGEWVISTVDGTVSNNEAQETRVVSG